MIKPTDKKLLSRVIENAFDFLETAINEFKEKPKYSILHFNTAIELFLKARLIDEHWSLIIANDDADKSRYIKGDFQSITQSKSIKKIRNVIGDEIPKECEDAFDAISKHRNKLVHFFHAELNGNPLPDTHKIASEQCLGWFHLKNLIRKWSKTFPDNQSFIQRLDNLMKNHREYLTIIFEQIQIEISKEKVNGIIFKICPSCGFESSKENAITENVKEYKCLVCPYSDQIITIDCPECQNEIEILQENNEPYECFNCGYQATKHEVATILETEVSSHDDYRGEVNCSNCWASRGTVVFHHQFYICIDCYTISDSVDTCEWCNEMQIPGGELEDSFLDGCEFCEGRLGNIKDD